MAQIANHIFLPWAQSGMAAGIPDQAIDRLAAEQPAVLSLPVRVVVNGQALEKSAKLYGPGDVVGIDPRQVVRTEPRHHTTDFESNLFPAVDFDRPDFPWLFTPAKAGEQGRLRPWLCLVVVRKQEGVRLVNAGTGPLPVLEIKSPARAGDELPDLAESHYWAHVQVTGAARSEIKAALSDAPRNVSRLLCPRRLDPTTDYIACVVPAFDVGVKAGLNQPPPQQNLAPAWLSGAGAPAEIVLPVYYCWEFRTASDSDFEELVRRLQPRDLPPQVGVHDVDIRTPGFSVQPPLASGAPGAKLEMEGALRRTDSKPAAWPDQARVPFQTALAAILNAPWEILTRENAGKDPILAPPVYGCWQSAVHQVTLPPAPLPPAGWPPPSWLNELNLDPRYRAIAAMGTQVVQANQEQLMASAWEQLGDIEKINQLRRQAQLSRAVNTRYVGKTFNRLPEESFIRVIAPAQSSVMITAQAAATQPATSMLLAQKLTASFVPPAAVSAPLRKFSRPRGAINRQYAQAGVAGGNGMFKLFNSTAMIMYAPAPVQGAATIDQASDKLNNLVDPAKGMIWVPEDPPHWERWRHETMPMINKYRRYNLGPENIVQGSHPSMLPVPQPEFAAAAKAHHEYLVTVFPPQIELQFFAPMFPQEVKLGALPALDPGATISRMVLDSARIASPAAMTGDALEPIMDAPTFPQPMYEGLRDLFQEYLFPGLEHVPPETVQLLQTNAKFIESFMVGLNTEMGRELLWRGYPTDQRGTYFQRFWDAQTSSAPERPDIPPIHQWGNRALGATAVGAGEDKLVLLIRGELLRRYPGTIIYAVKAGMKDGSRELSNPPVEEHPVFRGSLEPDVTFLGFNLTSGQVAADAGWYFVLQEQPTEPRFGLDDDPFSEGESGEVPALKTWNDLNWGHLAPDAAALKKLSHVSVAAVRLAASQPDKGEWGRNSAHMAFITRQRPARVAIHASELLPGMSLA